MSAPLDNAQDRVTRMADAYRTGRTLEEIGASERITRERVRQLLAKIGIAGKDGGATVRAMSRSANTAALKCERRESRCQQEFGCSWAEYVTLAGASRLYSSKSVSVAQRIKHSHPLLSMYGKHRMNATRCGIPWEFTLPAYAELVRPFLGREWRQDRLVLGRKSKRGPFSPENAVVTSLRENSTETQAQLRSEIHRAAVVGMKRRGLKPGQISAKTGLSIHTVKGFLYAEKNKAAL